MSDRTRPQKQLQAFLDLIAWSEGTSTHPLTRCNGYDVIVTGEQGPQVFTDFACHPFTLGRPPILVRSGPPELHSTASGRYQIVLPTWRELAEKYHIASFSPMSQDRAALALLVDCKALEAIYAGDLPEAIGAASAVWASFPGNLYHQGGQPLPALLENYDRFLNNPCD